MKTLYLSDLDGTLLRPDERTSEYTNSVIARLAESEAIFSFATARSAETALRATAGMKIRYPFIVHNGANIVGAKTQTVIWSAKFVPEERREIFEAFQNNGLCPLTYSVINGKNRFSYCKRLCGRAQWAFVLTRLEGERQREIFEEAALDGEVYYFACIDDEVKLRPVYEALKEKYRCLFTRDIYSGEQWLEVMPQEASKAHAALVLKKMYACDRLVCFGDHLNDIPMFEVADECYAVGNAAEALKKIATGVIGRNDEDGVAKWLEEHVW